MPQDPTPNPFESPSAIDFGHDPHSSDWEHEQQRSTYVLCRLGFGIASGALVIASFTTILTILNVFGFRHLVRAIESTGAMHWIDAPIVWGTLVGTYLLWGRWREGGWQRRSGLLLMMCFVDATLWLLDHANELGLHEGEVGHEWLRSQVGQALGWAEFTLFARLACDLLAHLGVEQAPEAGKATRSLAATGAVVWLIYFLKRTDWSEWPLRDQGINSAETLLLMMGVQMLWAITLIQVTALTIAATRQTNRVIAEMDRDQQEHAMFRSPSDTSEFLETEPGRKAKDSSDRFA